jgi:drug/metabolite transporter (DMT)-like permease
VTALAATAPTARRIPTPWIALVCVYVLWGSTYLGIRVAVESFPPFVMAGVRFLLAGAILYPIARRRAGGPPPTREQWLGVGSVALALLVGGNGLLSYAEQTVPSGVAALLVATVPLWLVLFDRLRGAARLRRQARVGLALGLAGIALLVRPWTVPQVDRVGALVVLVASVLWALGSIRSRSAAAPADGLVATGMQMLVGGAALTLAAGAVIAVAVVLIVSVRRGDPSPERGRRSMRTSRPSS